VVIINLTYSNAVNRMMMNLGRGHRIVLGPTEKTQIGPTWKVKRWLVAGFPPTSHHQATGVRPRNVWLALCPALQVQGNLFWQFQLSSGGRRQKKSNENYEHRAQRGLKKMKGKKKKSFCDPARWDAFFPELCANSTEQAGETRWIFSKKKKKSHLNEYI
jgi:hypothetical protein